MKEWRYSAPEREGVPSSAIESYVRAIESERLYMHSLMIVRHGNIIFEANWKPFDSNFVHRLYSCSKSFVSVAIGLLADKGLLRLDDKCVKFFPERRDLPEYLENATIRDLLRMAAPYTKGANYSPESPNWEDTFFSDEVSHAPGAVFAYCTSGTTMLCAIIKRVTGRNFMDILRPVFDEIGISKDAFCVETPEGIEWGGSGVCMTARDFAKFALLVMRRGEFEGRRLLPRDYLIEATSFQIDNSLDAYCEDSARGYGYQFWLTRNNGFAFFGMGGQYAICLPDKDLLVVTTGYEELRKVGRLEILRALWREIYPRLSDSPLDAAPNNLAALAASLELERARGAADSPVRSRIENKTYVMRPNAMGMKRVRFEFDGDFGKMYYENATGAHALVFGILRNVKARFPEIYSGKRLGTPAHEGYECYNSAAWVGGDSLLIYCHIADIHLGQLRLIAAFTEDTLTLRGVKHAEWFLDEYEGFAAGDMT